MRCPGSGTHAKATSFVYQDGLVGYYQCPSCKKVVSLVGKIYKEHERPEIEIDTSTISGDL